MIRIVVDTREKKNLLLREFKKLEAVHVVIERKKLDHGDIHVYIDNVLVAVIERKQTRDLNSSINDGRLLNLVDMVDFATLHRVPFIGLIVEGRLSTVKRGRMRSRDEIERYLDKLVRFCLPTVSILYTTNKPMTVKRVMELAVNLERRPISLMNENNRIMQRMLRKIPGISCDLALGAIERKYTPKRLINQEIDMKTLAKMRYTMSNNSIGDKKAKAILDNAKLLSTKIDVLAAIPYISKEDAENYIKDEKSLSATKLARIEQYYV